MAEGDDNNAPPSPPLLDKTELNKQQTQQVVEQSTQILDLIENDSDRGFSSSEIKAAAEPPAVLADNNEKRQSPPPTEPSEQSVPKKSKKSKKKSSKSSTAKEEVTTDEGDAKKRDSVLAQAGTQAQARNSSSRVTYVGPEEAASGKVSKEKKKALREGRNGPVGATAVPGMNRTTTSDTVAAVAASTAPGADGMDGVFLDHTQEEPLTITATAVPNEEEYEQQVRDRIIQEAVEAEVIQKVDSKRSMETTDQDRKARKRKYKWIIIGLIVLVLALAGGIVGAILGTRNKDDKRLPPPPLPPRLSGTGGGGDGGGGGGDGQMQGGDGQMQGDGLMSGDGTRQMLGSGSGTRGLGFRGRTSNHMSSRQIPIMNVRERDVGFRGQRKKR